MLIKMKQKKILVGVLILSVVLLVLGLNAVLTGITTPTVSMGEVDYTGSVCVKHIRDGEVLMKDCSPNVLFTATGNGADMVQDLLVGTSNGSIDWISLCNATNNDGCGTPIGAMTEAYIEYGIPGETTGCGLNATVGTVSDIPGQWGNWTVYKQFTSSCDNRVVNTTRLQNNTDGNFSGNTFDTVTLDTNDQLTVNWTLQVS